MMQIQYEYFIFSSDTLPLKPPFTNPNINEYNKVLIMYGKNDEK